MVFSCWFPPAPSPQVSKLVIFFIAVLPRRDRTKSRFFLQPFVVGYVFAVIVGVCVNCCSMSWYRSCFSAFIVAIIVLREMICVTIGDIKLMLLTYT